MHTNGKRIWLASFFDLSSSELKLLSNNAKNKFRTMKFPMTRVGRNMAKHVEAPCCKGNRSIRKEVEVYIDLTVPPLRHACNPIGVRSIHRIEYEKSSWTNERNHWSSICEGETRRVVLNILNNTEKSTSYLGTGSGSNFSGV